MTKKQLPWVLRGSDFSKKDLHTAPTAGFQLMFEFLRLSPSYELARKHRTRGLNQRELALLPADFDQVLKTYDLLGDVSSDFFRSWWLKRGLLVFGNPYKKPRVHSLGVLNAGMTLELGHIAPPITTYLNNERHEEGLNASLLLSVPLTLKRSDLLKQISKLISDHGGVDTELEKKPQLKLVSKRLRPDVLFKGLTLLWTKAARPNWELWRLGAKAELSQSYSKELDPNAPKKVKTSFEKDDRIIMSKITSRYLAKYEAIAENAARGLFPTDRPVLSAGYDYPLIAKRLQARSILIREKKAAIKQKLVNLNSAG
jgi:hypothetical protein